MNILYLLKQELCSLSFNIGLDLFMFMFNKLRNLVEFVKKLNRTCLT